jgi:hypothetical protein
MRPLLLFRSLALGLLVGAAGWRGTDFLVREGRPARLLERAESIAPASPKSGLTAILLFRPDECPQLMRIVAQLNDLDTLGVRIVGGLMVESHRMPDWQLLVTAQGIRFPVFQLDPPRGRSAIASLGYAGAPLLIVFDRYRRVLLATDALNDQRNLQPFFGQLIQRFVEKPDNRRVRV